MKRKFNESLEKLKLIRFNIKTGKFNRKIWYGGRTTDSYLSSNQNYILRVFNNNFISIKEKINDVFTDNLENAAEIEKIKDYINKNKTE